MNNGLKTDADDNHNVVKFIVMNYYKIIASISFGENVLKQLMFSSLFGFPLSMEGKKAAYRTIFEKVIRASRNFPDFINLPSKLQTSLLKHNACMLVCLCRIEERKFPDQMTDSLSTSDMEILRSMISSVPNITVLTRPFPSGLSSCTRLLKLTNPAHLESSISSFDRVSFSTISPVE